LQRFRPVAFYDLIGFKQAIDLTQQDDEPKPSFGAMGLGPALNLPDDCARCAAAIWRSRTSRVCA
jgi:hypothetical protein